MVRRFQTRREGASEGLVSDAIKRMENLKCLIKQISAMERINTPKVSTLAREGDHVHTAQRGPCFQQHNILGSAERTSANGVPFFRAETLSKVLVSSVPHFGDVFPYL